MTRNETVDVLIIGSGASGAAVAWSLAETRMNILCLEQGGWTRPTDFPANGRDWEARRYGDFAISPNERARVTDYPVNDADSPMKVANFNGVGGGTIFYTAHFPRLHPSDFRVRSLDGVASGGISTPARRRSASMSGVESPESWLDSMRSPWRRSAQAGTAPAGVVNRALAATPPPL